MKTVSLLLLIGLLALGGCGSDNDDSNSDSGGATTGAAAGGETNDAPEDATQAAAGGATSRKGTAVVLGDSEFGRMLFDSKRQAIYIFQRDRPNRSRCYGICAREWPPVYTKGKPRARRGVKTSLLGTIKRRGGRLQVTYAGKPLYYYAHESRGEVKCHNVNLNGGFWWAVGPNGKRRP
jgi:predicted lipoprotein with Yx(FWY)xxD motif